MNQRPVQALPSALRIVGPFALAYFISYFYRSMNAVIAPDLVRAFTLTAADLGLITSAYFLAFAAFQLPLGLLLDRFGPRRVDSGLLLIAGTGAVVFGTAQSPFALLAGRALIGLGVCACLMSSIKAVALWFPAQRLAAMNAWIFFCGGMGALAATTPVEMLLQQFDWRAIFVGLAAATLVASALIFFVAPEREGVGEAETLGMQWRGLLDIFAHAMFWRLAAATVVFQASHMAVQGLWAGPWLKDVAQLSRTQIALQLMLLGASIVAGFLFWGHAASWLARRGVALTTVLKAGLSTFLAVQVPIALGIAELSWLTWIGFGFFGTAGSLAFSVVSQSYPLTLTGRANTALNLLVFSCAFATQWLIGAVVNHWPVAENSYHADGYRAAFGLLWIAEALSLAWLYYGTRSSRAV